MKRTHSSTVRLLLMAAYVICSPAIAQNTSIEEDLRRRIREKEAEISSLRQQLEGLGSKQPSVSPVADTEPSSSALPTPSQPLATAQVGSRPDTEEAELASALESALIRQGGAVLSPGTFEIEPELSYFYDDQNTGTRRDHFGTAVSLRFGLPAAMQAEVYVPYVIRDRLSGVDSTSGIGDVSLGLTKQLVKDQDGIPALLAFAFWRTTTGDINKPLPTGFGQHAIQIGITATKRKDPVLLLGSLSYTANLGSASLSNGARLNSGNVFGMRLGANLAATPDTSFYWGISYNSSNADRVNNERIEVTDRARGILELGSTTVIGRGRFFNLGIGLGVTSAAPKFSITASVPFRF